MSRGDVEGAGWNDAALEMKNVEGGEDDNEPRETDFHPYVKVRVSTNNAIKKTRALDHSDMNPEWNEALVFDIPGRMKLKREGSVSQSILSLSGLGSNRKKNETHGLGLISTLKAVNHGPEEIEFSFEAWHKDAKMSLDDKIGSANLGLPLSKFSNEDHWTSRESVRLYDERGIASDFTYSGKVEGSVRWGAEATRGVGRARNTYHEAACIKVLLRCREKREPSRSSPQ